MAVTFTFLDAIVVLELMKHIGGSMDLAKKRHGSPDLHTPIHPPRKGCGVGQKMSYRFSFC